MLLQEQLAGIILVGILAAVACSALICMTIHGAARLIFEGIMAASMKGEGNELPK